MLSRVTEGNDLPTMTSTSVIWVGHMQLLLSLVLSLCFVFAVGVRASVCVDPCFFFFFFLYRISLH